MFAVDITSNQDLLNHDLRLFSNRKPHAKIPSFLAGKNLSWGNYVLNHRYANLHRNESNSLDNRKRPTIRASVNHS